MSIYIVTETHYGDVNDTIDISVHNSLEEAKIFARKHVEYIQDIMLKKNNSITLYQKNNFKNDDIVNHTLVVWIIYDEHDKLAVKIIERKVGKSYSELSFMI